MPHLRVAARLAQPQERDHQLGRLGVRQRFVSKVLKRRLFSCSLDVSKTVGRPRIAAGSIGRPRKGAGGIGGSRIMGGLLGRILTTLVRPGQGSPSMLADDVTGLGGDDVVLTSARRGVRV